MFFLFKNWSEKLLMKLKANSCWFAYNQAFVKNYLYDQLMFRPEFMFMFIFDGLVVPSNVWCEPERYANYPFPQHIKTSELFFPQDLTKTTHFAHSSWLFHENFLIKNSFNLVPRTENTTNLLCGAEWVVWMYIEPRSGTSLKRKTEKKKFFLK